MITVANRFQIADEYADAFVERFADSMGNVEAQPGFVKFELLTPVKGDAYVAMTYWESREDFEAWTDTQEFHDAHSGDAPEGMFTGHPELEIHEVAFERQSE